MATTLAPQTGTRTWNLDTAHTSVEFAVKHLMISTVKGRFGDVTGAITGDINKPESFELNVDIDVSSIDTRQGQRDAHLRSADFFDAEQFPTIRFVGKKIVGDVDNDFRLV